MRRLHRQRLGTAAIPEKAKASLLLNPTLKTQFDAKYGVGAADAVLRSGAR
jgi:hypothetical protein